MRRQHRVDEGVMKKIFLCAIIAMAAGMFFAPAAFAADGGTPESSAALTFLWVAIILLFAKATRFIERYGQPPVLGELVAGVVLGSLFLVGINWFEPIKNDPRINFLAQLGVVILLFQVGLDTNIHEMRKVGIRALLVACVGVVTPFVLGTFIVGPMLLPGLSANAYIFLGATLTATSVGITARVFQDLGVLKSREAQIVLGAAVIDDVLGLIILAIVSAIATEGRIDILSVAFITFKAALFLIAAIALGLIFAPRFGRIFSRINTGLGMKFTIAISFGLVVAFIADLVGLAPIVGAFAAGLVLDPVHFRYFEEARMIADVRKSLKDAAPEVKAHLMPIVEHHATRHIDDLIDPLGHFLVPIFFVTTGMGVKLESFLNLPILAIGLGMTVVAFVGKIASGLVAGKANKLVVGWGMIPRGEVGLIFAASGKSLGVISDEIFSMIVIVIILSTFLTPPVLAFIIRTSQLSEPTGQEASPAVAVSGATMAESPAGGAEG